MDPLTIVNAAGASLSLAKTAWEVGTSLYVFFEAAKKVDESLRAFSEEVKALGAACEVIGTRLEDIHNQTKDKGITSPLGRADKLWTCLQDQLAACQKTILSLQDAVRMPSGTEHRTGFFDKVFKQIVLELKANDIAEVRNRIRSHTASLQIVLQGMTIEITYLAPHRADQELHVKLAELSKKNDELVALVKERQTSPTTGEADSKMLLQASSQIISSGETLYAESIAGGSVIGTSNPVTLNRVTTWIDHTNALEDINSNADTSTETDTMSLWTDRIATSEETLSIYTPQTTSNNDPLGLNMTRTSTLPEEDEDAALDSDDEFQLEAATHAIDAGREAFEAEDWTTTDKMLQEALLMIRELPISLQKQYDGGDLRYMLSVCTFHLHDAATAKATLISFVEHNSVAKVQDDKKRLRICDAGHLLAQACIKLGEYEQARTYCESAMQGRRRLLGKKHETTFESLALMVRILELQGTVERATILARMIPSAQRASIVRYRAIPTPAESIKKFDPAASSSNLSQTSSIDSDLLTKSTRQLSIGQPIVRKQVPPRKKDPNYKNEYLALYVGEHGYQKPMPLSRDKAVRKLWSNKFYFAIKTKLLKALYEGRDEDALILSRGGKGGWLDRHYEAGGPPELHVSALYGQHEIVEQLLSLKADVTYQSRWGLQPLHCAAAAGYTNIARSLIAAGAPIDVSSDYVGTPLALAVAHQRLDIVDLLLTYSASPTTSIGRLGTPLHLAATTNNLYLLLALSQISPTSLSQTATIDLSALSNLLAEYHLSNPQLHPYHPVIDARAGWRRAGYITGRPLDLACLLGCAEIVKHLLAREVFIPTTSALAALDDKRKEVAEHTPLSLAALGGNVEVVKALMRVVDAGEWSGVVGSGDRDERVSPLYCAAMNRHVEVVDLLLKGGARASRWLAREARTAFLRDGKTIGAEAEMVLKRLEDSVSEDEEEDEVEKRKRKEREDAENRQRKAEQYKREAEERAEKHKRDAEERAEKHAREAVERAAKHQREAEERVEKARKEREKREAERLQREEERRRDEDRRADEQRQREEERQRGEAARQEEEARRHQTTLAGPIAPVDDDPPPEYVEVEHPR